MARVVVVSDRAALHRDWPFTIAGLTLLPLADDERYESIRVRIKWAFHAAELDTLHEPDGAALERAVCDRLEAAGVADFLIASAVVAEGRDWSEQGSAELEAFLASLSDPADCAARAELRRWVAALLVDSFATQRDDAPEAA